MFASHEVLESGHTHTLQKGDGRHYSCFPSPPADERVHGVSPQWVVVDRIVSIRGATGTDEVEYLVKWKDLGYEQCRCGID